MPQKFAAVFVTCTKRKTATAASATCLGRVAKGRPSAVAAAWIGRLEAQQTSRIPAARLYSGDHWKIASQLPNAAKQAGVIADLWVVSAGYGLIPSHAAVASYSATFSKGHPDEIETRLQPTPANPKASWWEELARWPGPLAGSARRIRDVARGNPRAPLLVVASPSYLEAIEVDLLEAAESLEHPSRLIIVAAGARKSGALVPFLVDCDSGFQAALGGARMSLNQRIARHILLNSPPWPWSAEGFSHTLASTCPKLHVAPRCTGKKLTDSEVKRFLQKKMSSDPQCRPTGLLRELRSSGISCEQKRFKALFHQVAEARHG
jgi:hypothetical protein